MNAILVDHAGKRLCYVVVGAFRAPTIRNGMRQPGRCTLTEVGEKMVIEGLTLSQTDCVMLLDDKKYNVALNSFDDGVATASLSLK